MKSAAWICIIYVEIVLSLILIAAIAFRWYGLPAPPACPISHSIHTSAPATGCLPKPTPRNVPRHIAPDSIHNEGWATWYSRASCQREGTGGKQVLMANNKPLRDNTMTCALWRIGKHGRPLRPTGELVRIRNVQSGKTLLVAWTDNGPGKKARDKKVIVDLTPAAMLALAGEAGIKAGCVEVKVLK